MILARYLVKRFLLYFICVAGLLTLLYNLIEFFEKLMRVTHAPLADVAAFIGLNLAPSFFDLMHVSCWIATGLLIKDLHSSHAWESIQLLGIHPRAIMRIFLFVGIAASLVSLFGKEWATHRISQQALRFKMTHFKADSHQKIFNKWFDLKDNVFVHISFLDLDRNQGEGLLWLKLADSFTLARRIFIHHFTIKNHTFHATKKAASLFDGTQHIAQEHLALKLPELTAQLHLHAQVPTVMKLATTLVAARNLLSPTTLHKELSSLLTRVLTHLQPLFYLLLPLAFFLLFPFAPLIRWLGILATYPVLLLFTTLCEFLSHHGLPAWIVAAPYLVATITLIVLHRMFCSNQSNIAACKSDY